MMALVFTAIELGLYCSLTVLALFLSYTILNVCDLSTDGCFTLGACVGAVVSLSGHPYLSIPCAMLAGMISGFVVSMLQMKMGINSLLAGIIVNTGLYSINIAIMSGSSLLNMNKTVTIFTILKDVLSNTPLSDYYQIIIGLIANILVIVFLTFFLKTKLGLAIQATGNNPAMVRSSSISPVLTTTIGLCIANAFTALSGCLFAQAQKSVSIDVGSGMLTIALASLLIGYTLSKKGSAFKKASFAVIGAIIFRMIYMIALRFEMKAYMLKLVSSIIIVLAISLPYLKEKYPEMLRRMNHRKERDHA